MKSIVLILAVVIAGDFVQAQVPRTGSGGRTQRVPLREKGRVQPPDTPVKPPIDSSKGETPTETEVDKDLKLNQEHLKKSQSDLREFLRGYDEAKFLPKESNAKNGSKFNKLALAFYNLQGEVSREYIRAVANAINLENDEVSIFTIENIEKTYKHIADPGNYEEMKGKIGALNEIISIYAKNIDDKELTLQESESVLRDAAVEVLGPKLEESEMNKMISNLFPLSRQKKQRERQIGVNNQNRTYLSNGAN